VKHDIRGKNETSTLKNVNLLPNKFADIILLSRQKMEREIVSVLLWMYLLNENLQIHATGVVLHGRASWFG
jgi:hypothetical protein